MNPLTDNHGYDITPRVPANVKFARKLRSAVRQWKGFIKTLPGERSPRIPRLLEMKMGLRITLLIDLGTYLPGLQREAA